MSRLAFLRRCGLLCGKRHRSNDAGATWARAGLDDSRQIGRVLVDPRDAKTVLVAALGHAYGPNATRGVFRSSDAGRTWTQTLFRGPDVGAIDLAADPAMHVVYASLWQTRRPPWSAYPPFNGPGSGLYTSADRGLTWTPLRGNGLPADGLGKIGVAVAPSKPQRVYALVDAKAGGLYRSDDAGAHWKLLDGDERLWDRGWYFAHVAVDPEERGRRVRFEHVALPFGRRRRALHRDQRFARRRRFSRHLDRSGRFVAHDRRQRSGRERQPRPRGDVEFVVQSADGPVLSRRDGRCVSVSVLRSAARQRSRGDRVAQRSPRHRRTRLASAGPGGESGTIAPDPRDENTVFGSQLGGAVVRENLRANQTQDISPTLGRPGVWRQEWTLPLAFGRDGALYYSNQTIFRTRDGGDRWSAVSGDLARRNAGIPATLDPATAADADTAEPRGVVCALARSPLRADIVWAGTDDGLVYLGAPNERTWRNVTPPEVTPWSRVAGIEASHFDARTAYVAIDRHRLDDVRPYVYVTHDAGRNWRSANAGSFVNAVREDPVRPGLLYAATETGVFVSFDDGAAWQSLALDMPVVSVRDISVHGSDLAIATHGRAFWILDDIEPLRESAALRSGAAHLFAPRDAVRTRGDNDEAEALPPETPLGENPPNGAMIDYRLAAGSNGPVRLELYDAHGTLVRRWSSADAPRPESPEKVPYPSYWIPSAAALSAQPGMHRFVWDFRVRRADGPFAPPGRYEVRLSAGSQTWRRPLRLARDPRVRASDADLVVQAAVALQLDTLLGAARAALARRAGASAASLAPLVAVAGSLEALENAIESADARADVRSHDGCPKAYRGSEAVSALTLGRS